MRAVVVHETGGVGVLQLEEIPRPEPADGEVLVAIKAASVNPIDWKIRQGMVPKELPAVLGSDVSGIVEVSRAEGFSAGEEVFGFVGSGAYAQFGIGMAKTLAHKPGALSHEQAAALPVASLTAWQALFDRGNLKAGETVVISGGAGGVGHLAVQLAKDADARVIATGSERSREYVLGLGADEFVDYTKQDVASAVEGADFAFDTVGGETILELLRTVRSGGRMIVIAGAPPEAAAEANVDAQLLLMSPDAGELERIGTLVADGVIHVEVGAVMALEEIQQAHELSESHHARGKIVLRV